MNVILWKLGHFEVASCNITQDFYANLWWLWFNALQIANLNIVCLFFFHQNTMFKKFISEKYLHDLSGVLVVTSHPSCQVVKMKLSNIAHKNLHHLGPVWSYLFTQGPLPKQDCQHLSMNMRKIMHKIWHFQNSQQNSSETCTTDL